MPKAYMPRRAALLALCCCSCNVIKAQQVASLGLHTLHSGLHGSRNGLRTSEASGAALRPSWLARAGVGAANAHTSDTGGSDDVRARAGRTRARRALHDDSLATSAPEELPQTEAPCTPTPAPVDGSDPGDESDTPAPTIAPAQGGDPSKPTQKPPQQRKTPAPTSRRRTTAQPTAQPTARPTAHPTAQPTAKPTLRPTATPAPTPLPTPLPTQTDAAQYTLSMLTRFEGQDLDTFDSPQQEAFIATVAAASGEGADVVITRISQASGTAVRHLRGRRRRSLQGAASAGSFTAEYQVQHVQGEAAAAAAGDELVRQSLTGQLLKEFQAAPGADGSTATRLDTRVVGITREQPPGAKRANVAAVVVSVLAGVLLVAAAAVCYARARARKLMMTEALPKSHAVSSSSVMTVSAVYELDPDTEMPVQQQVPLPPSKLTVNTELPRRPRAPLAEHCTTAEGTPVTCTYPGAGDPFPLSAAPARPQQQQLQQQQRGDSASPTRGGGSRRNIMRALGASGRSLGRQGSKRLSTAPSSRSFTWRPPAYRKTASVPDGSGSLSLRALMGGGGAAAAARRASWSSRQRSTRFGGKKAWLSDRDMGLQLQAERCGVAPPAHESMSTRARAAVAAANTFYPSNLNTPIKSVYDSGGGGSGSEGDSGDEFDVEEGDTFHIEETGADRAARLGAAGMTPRYRPDFHHMFRANQPLDAKIYTAAATEERKPADWSTRNFPSGNGGGDENARTAALVRAAANKSACIAKYFQLCGQPSKNTRAIAQWAADVFASLDAVAEHMSVATPHSVPEVDGLAMERAHKTIKRLMNIVRHHRAQGTLAECAQQTETTELVAAAARQAVEAVINAPSVTQAELALLCAPQLDIIAETPQPTRAQMGFTHYRRYDIKSGHAI